MISGVRQMRMREPTCAASFPKSFLEFAGTRGVDRRQLLQRACIQPEDLVDPTARIPLVRYVAMLEAGIELSDNPALALEYGEHVPMDDLSIVALIATNAETVEDSRAKINRYAPLLVDNGDDNADAAQFVQRDGKLW